VNLQFGLIYRAAVFKPDREGEKIMYIHVYTDKDGRIVATHRAPQGISEDGPNARIHPGPEHQVHQIELTDHLASIKSARELHQELEKLLNPHQA
jgi:hypothetical protein